MRVEVDRKRVGNVVGEGEGIGRLLRVMMVLLLYLHAYKEY